MARSDLAWTQLDYEAAGEEIPARVRDNPQMTEGELMTADEVAEFIKDSIATLRILADKNSPRYDDLIASYRLDLAYLAEIGQIDDDDYNGLTDEATLRFGNT